MRSFSKPVTTANAAFRNDKHLLVFFLCFPLTVGIEFGLFFFFLFFGFLSNLILNVFWKRASAKWERLFMCLQLSLHFTALQNWDLSSGHFAGSGALSPCLSFWLRSCSETPCKPQPLAACTWEEMQLEAINAYLMFLFSLFLHIWDEVLEHLQYWQQRSVQVRMEQVAQGGDRCHVPGRIQGHLGWCSEKPDAVEGSLQNVWTRWPLKVPSNPNCFMSLWLHDSCGSLKVSMSLGTC